MPTTTDYSLSVRIFVGAVSLLLLALLIGASLLLGGYTIMMHWKWFITPFGFAPITLPLACGLGLILNLVRPPRVALKEEYLLPVWQRVLSSFVTSLILLAIGYIVSLYM